MKSVVKSAKNRRLNIVRKKQNIDKIKYHRLLIFSFTTIILIIFFPDIYF